MPYSLRQQRKIRSQITILFETFRVFYLTNVFSALDLGSLPVLSKIYDLQTVYIPCQIRPEPDEWYRSCLRDRTMPISTKFG